MSSKKKWTVASAAAVLLAAGTALTLFLYHQLSSRSVYPVEGPAPEFTLPNVDGREVSIANTNGKARLVYFYFSHCPDVCQPTNYLLSQVQKELKRQGENGEKTAIFSISFDPERDTVERLLEYSAKYKADYNIWHFLRGEGEEVIDLAKEYQIGVMKLENGDFAHANAVILIDKDGNIRHYYMSEALEPDNAPNIASDMLKLAKE